MWSLHGGISHQQANNGIRLKFWTPRATMTIITTMVNISDSTNITRSSNSDGNTDRDTTANRCSNIGNKK